MSISALKIRDALIRKISTGKIEEAELLVERMKTYASSCKITREKVEILTECGLAYFQMGNLDQSIKTLIVTLANSSPGSHEQAILHWMLGEVQWNVTSEQFSAMKTWEIAKEELDILATQADYDNLPSTRDWYRNTSDHVETVLRQRATTASFG